MLADDAVAAIQRAARSVSPHSLFVTAVGDGVTVVKARGGELPLAQVYANGEALVAAVARGEVGAVGAALRGLACLDAESVRDVALALARPGGGVAPELRRAAMFALARSRDDAALDVLATALDGAADAPCAALARSVHPGASARARAALEASGAASFDAVVWPLLGVERDGDTEVDGERPAESRSPSQPKLQIAARAVGVLAARGDRGSFDVIARMFDGHPDRDLRRACAEALAIFDDPRAHAALDARWADADPAVAAIAVAATLRREPSEAWRRFAPHAQAALADSATSGDVAILKTLLEAIAAAARAAAAAPDRDVLAIEPRFLDLAARLRGHPRLGEVARTVLDVAPVAVAIAAIDRYPRRGPRITRGPVPSRRDFIARYLGGEHAVWDELVGHAAAISLHADFRDEAAAVAVELMARVQRNAAALAPPPAGAAPAGEADLERLIALAGPLPLSLDALWSTCGALDLRPAAPLVVLGPAACAAALAAYERRVADSHREIVGPLTLAIVPPHAIELPTTPLADAIDPVLVGTGTRLVAHLRAVFAEVAAAGAPDVEPF